MADPRIASGSPRPAPQISDSCPPIRIDYFQPYGSQETAELVTKVGFEVPVPPPKATSRKVERLNTGKR